MLNVSMASVFMAIEEMKQKGIIPLDIEGNDNEEEKSKVTMSQYQAEVKILIDKGMSNKEIAEQLNRSIESVKSAKYQLNKKGLLDGIKNKEKKAVSQKNYTSYREEVKKLLEEGMSNQEIAERLNCSLSSVYNCVNALRKKMH